MITATTDIPTRHGDKYVRQLCKHWAHKLEIELTDQQGIVRFPVAVATMRPRQEALSVTVEAEDEETLARMKDVVATHLDRFAFREAPLRFDW